MAHCGTEKTLRGVFVVRLECSVWRVGAGVSVTAFGMKPVECVVLRMRLRSAKIESIFGLISFAWESCRPVTGARVGHVGLNVTKPWLTILPAQASVVGDSRHLIMGRHL